MPWLVQRFSKHARWAWVGIASTKREVSAAGGIGSAGFFRADCCEAIWCWCALDSKDLRNWCLVGRLWSLLLHWLRQCLNEALSDNWSFSKCSCFACITGNIIWIGWQNSKTKTEASWLQMTEVVACYQKKWPLAIPPQLIKQCVSRGSLCVPVCSYNLPKFTLISAWKR